MSSPETSDDERVEQPIGPVLDDLGVKIGLTSTEHVTQVYVIAKIVDLKDKPGVAALALCSNGLDWIAQRGLMSAAESFGFMNDLVNLRADDDED